MVQTKVDMLAEMNDSYSIDILSTGQWDTGVPDDLFGL